MSADDDSCVNTVLLSVPEEEMLVAPQIVGTSCNIRIKISQPSTKKTRGHSWLLIRVSCVLNLVLLSCLGMVVMSRVYQEDRKGVLSIRDGKVRWVQTCPSYTAPLSDLGVEVQGYSLVQVQDQVVLCGGYGDREDQARTCLTLSLTDGEWRLVDHQLVYPRIRSVMLVDRGRVVVMGGTTSHVNSGTGCRDTREVLHPGGWVVETVQEMDICHTAVTNNQLVVIDC